MARMSKKEYNRQLAEQQKHCTCDHLHTPWYHEVLEDGKTYVVRGGADFGGFVMLDGNDAPYWAKVLKLENGYAHCRCTDGELRTLPTPMLGFLVRTRTMCGL